MKYLKLFEEFHSVNEAALQYTTYDEKGGIGRYRLKSDEVDLSKVLNYSRYKHGTSIGDEIGFDSESERKEFINIFKKLDKQGKLLQFAGDLFYTRKLTTPAKLRKYMDKIDKQSSTSNRGNDWKGPDTEFDSKR
jgi:hypothetical protein